MKQCEQKKLVWNHGAFFVSIVYVVSLLILKDFLVNQLWLMNCLSATDLQSWQIEVILHCAQSLQIFWVNTKLQTCKTAKGCKMSCSSQTWPSRQKQRVVSSQKHRFKMTAWNKEFRGWAENKSMQYTRQGPVPAHSGGFTDLALWITKSHTIYQRKIEW